MEGTKITFEHYEYGRILADGTIVQGGKNGAVAKIQPHITQYAALG